MKAKRGRPKNLTPKHNDSVYDKVLELIKEGNSVTQAVKQFGMTKWHFYEKVKNNEAFANLYACACEIRAFQMFDEIIEIADDSSNDDKITEFGTVENKEWVNRSRLRIDARKWALSKMMPKKYGDKLDVTTDGEKITTPTPVIQRVIIVKPDEDE
jgi:hypothetical protein